MKQILETLKTKRREMMDACTERDTDKNYIIVIGSLAVSPDYHKKGGLSNGFPHSVERFSKEEAEVLAAKCFNGEGTRGKAEYWRAATEDAINDVERCLGLLVK